MPEACKVLDVLEDILEHVFQNLHDIQKNLQFWQSRAEVSKRGPIDRQKLFPLEEKYILYWIVS